jgi:hypothetical protein
MSDGVDHRAAEYLIDRFQLKGELDLREDRLLDPRDDLNVQGLQVLAKGLGAAGWRICPGGLFRTAP